MQFRTVALATIVFATFVASAGAAITHRYTFNDGTANDSVGTANGTLMNGAAASTGELRFSPTVNNGVNNPATGQYVSLPSNVLKSTNFTIEAWATTAAAARWQRIIDVGNVGGQGFTILTPYNNQDSVLGQVSIATAGGGGDTNFVVGRPPGFAAISLNREYYYAYVHDRTAGTESLYVNGVLVGTSTATVDPATTNYSKFYIGRSNFLADPYWVGSINEVRTYDSAMTSADVAASYAAGATVPEPAGAIVTLLLGGACFGSRSRVGRCGG